jgi:FSR family fosmidomycin resistance protein-like MFS transporter
MTAATPEHTERTREERRTLSAASGAHALHDGYTDLIYVMLPVWQAEFGLSYAAVGLLRGLFAGTMAGLQIPASLLADRIGPVVVLAGGTALAGLGYCLAGLSGSFAMLLAALLIGGVGASTQHPIASALVAHAFAGPRSLKALGGYNFAGDIGKMTVPALAAAMIALMPWRPALALLGACGVAAAIAILVVTPRPRPEPAQDTTAHAVSADVAAPRYAFPTLLSIGVIDSATRMGFLTFLPFILAAKGASLPSIGLALTLVFAGGAAGKLVCAFIGARLGTTATVCLTEALTALLILAMLPLPLEAAMPILPAIGIALNGTSSVLYGSVPDLVAPDRRTRAFGIFYTGTIGAGAIAPIFYGLAGDALGLTQAVVAVALIVVVTIPLALILRPALSHQRQSPSAA